LERINQKRGKHAIGDGREKPFVGFNDDEASTLSVVGPDGALYGGRFGKLQLLDSIKI